MMGSFKYVMDVKKNFVIFPRTMKHTDYKNLHPTMYLICSAGFVSFEGNEIQCYGRSDTLNIDSRGKVDSEIMKSFYEA